MSKLSTVNKLNFDQVVLNNSRPVLVDFYADWCGPCTMQTPVLEELAAQYQGKIDVVKVDVDKDQLLLSEYGIRSIPTLILFNKGENVATRVGVSNKKQLADFVKAVA